MAAISISVLATFFNVEPKSINRGENYYNSKHVEFQQALGQCKGAKKAQGNDPSIPMF